MRCESTYIIWYIRVDTYRVLMGKFEGKRPVGRTGVDGKLKLKWILNNSDWGVGG